MQINTSTNAVTPQPDITLPKPPEIALYVALLTQADTAAPTATILHNTLGNIVWTRDSQGIYFGTLTGKLPPANTTVNVMPTNNDFYEVQNTDENRIRIITTDITQTVADGLLQNTPVEIKVYQNTTIRTNDIQPITPPYKIYAAQLTQTSTNAPTANILQNTLGGIIWTRDSEGTYVATLTGELTTNKLYVQITPTSPTTIYWYDWDLPNALYITVLDEALSAADGLLNNTNIEIRVYN